MSAKSLQLCPILKVCSLAGSSVHGISQARILDGVAIFFFRGSSQCRGQRGLLHLLQWQAGSLPLANASKNQKRLIEKIWYHDSTSINYMKFNL